MVRISDTQWDEISAPDNPAYSLTGSGFNSFNAATIAPPQEERISDGLGHYWDSASQGWMNESGGAYQETPQQNYSLGGQGFNNFNVANAAPSWVDDAGYNGGGYYQDQWGNRGAAGTDTWTPAETPQVPFAPQSWDQPAPEPTNYSLGFPTSALTGYGNPLANQPWGANQPQYDQGDPNFLSDLRVTDPMQNGYKEDVRFPTGGGMLGSPLDAANDWFFDPIAEAGAQLTPSLIQGAASATPIGFQGANWLSDKLGYDLEGNATQGRSDFGAAVKDSGGNPFEFGDIQNKNFDERPMWQQLAAGAVYDPTNLLGVSALRKIGVLGEVGDFGDVAKLGKLGGTFAGSDVIPAVTKNLDEFPHFAPDLTPGSTPLHIFDNQAVPELGGAQAFAKGVKPGVERTVIPASDRVVRPLEGAPDIQRWNLEPDDIVQGRTARGSISYPSHPNNAFSYVENADGSVRVMGMETYPSIDDAVRAVGEKIGAIAQKTDTGPQPLANDRLWFHSTRDMAYDLPDPDMAVGTQTGITQGPGVYMAADPAKSAGNYGPRTFVAEFDGKTLDLTKQMTPDMPVFEGGPSWNKIRDDLAAKLEAKGMDGSVVRRAYDGPNLNTAMYNAKADLANMADDVANGYVYKQALIDAVSDATRGMGGAGVTVREGMLGRFAAGLDRPGNALGLREMDGAIVQNHLADEGVDALFHHSPKADGDVLIVLNGDAARVVADVKNAPDAVKGGATLKDIKRGAIGKVVTTAKDNRYGIRIADTPGPDGVTPNQWLTNPKGEIVGTAAKYRDGNIAASIFTADQADVLAQKGGFSTMDAAVAWMKANAPTVRKADGTSLRSFGSRIAGESGGALTDTAARLGLQTGLGAGVGAAYGEASGGDWKTGALVGAGIGAGASVAFKGTDALASRTVKTAIDTNPPPEGARKLIDLVKAAKPIRESQESLYSAERARRAAIGSSILQKGGDARQAFSEARGSLGGALPKTRAFEQVENQMDAADVTSLFDHIRNTELRGAGQNDFYTKLNAEGALTKVLLGELPTRSEIVLLGKVFGDDFEKAILGKRGLGAKAWENFVDSVNLPRTLMTSWDASAPLRQGALLGAGHPIEGVKSAGAMIRAMASPKYAKMVAEGIENSPNQPLYEKMGLFFADAHVGAELTAREENIMSRLATKIPGIDGSQRGYTTYLNKLRQGVADNFIAGNPNLSDKELKDFGHVINIMSGRGDLPKKLADQSALMNAAFAPRYAMSRLQLPGEMVKALAGLATSGKVGTSVPAAKELAKDVILMAGTGVSILALGKAAGFWHVELDPRSTDFGKGRKGETRVDFWAGEQQLARTATQLILGQRKTSTGNITDASRKETLIKWFNTKTSPPVGLARDLYTGKDFAGQPVDWKNPGTISSQTWQRLAPLFLQDMADAAKVNQNPWAAAKAAPSALGAAVMTYEDSDALKRKKWIAENAGMLTGNLVQPGKTPDRYENLSPSGKQLVNSQYGKSEPFGAEAKDSAEVLKVITTQQQASDSKRDSGELTPEEWRKDYSARKEELAIRNEQIYSKLDLKTKDPILAGYYGAIDKAKGADGTIDWDAVDAYVAQHPDQADYIAKNTGLVKIDTPKTQEFKKDYDAIKESGYFLRTDKTWEAIRDSFAVEEPNYYKWKDQQVAQTLSMIGGTTEQPGKLAQAESIVSKMPAVKFMEESVSDWKKQWAVENSEEAYKAWKLGYYDPVKEIKAYLQAKYE